MSFAAREAEVTKALMKVLGREQDEAEKKYEYEERVKDDAVKELDLG